MDMTSKQLVARALQGLDIPRAATGPLAVHYCARLAGVSLRRYTTDAATLADCVVQYYERFRPDAVWLSADTWVTAEAAGATVGFTSDDQPLGGTGEPLVHRPADIERLAPPDPSTQGRWPLMLEALQRIRHALGAEVFVVACFDPYPFSLACALMGINDVMLNLYDDRALVEALMERCLEYALAYARALDAVGADMLSGGDSPAGLLGPDLYREIALPFEQRLIGQLKSATATPVSLHICGDTTPILADMATTGADVLELDWQVDAAEACRIMGPDIALWGNLDPVRLLAQGSADQVRQATGELLQDIAASGHRRFVLSSGCTLAVETPSQNLQAMLAVARDWKGVA